MPRLSRRQEEARQRIVALARTWLLPTQLASHLLTILDAAIPSDLAGLLGLDPVTLVANRLLAVSPGALGDALDYVQHLYLREPFPELTQPWQMRARRAVFVQGDRFATSWGLPDELAKDPAAAATFRGWVESYGLYHSILRSCFAADGQWLAWLELVRLDARRPFQRSDIAFMQLMAPAIGRALRTAFVRERACARGGEPGLDAAGVLVLASDGRPRFQNPAAEAWVRLLRDGDTGGDQQLPLAIWAAIARLRAGGSPDRQPRVHVPTPRGLVQVEASIGDRDDTIAVVLAPERPPLPPQLPVTWPLTPQERQVVELLLHGLTSRQLASRMVVSESTIHSHLAHVYEKLGVASRSQLLARFFLETYWPTLDQHDLMERQA